MVDSPTQLPPWEAFYPDWTEELAAIGSSARAAVPTLCAAFPRGEPRAAVELARVALELADGSAELRREVARSIAAADGPWERSVELAALLDRHRLPKSRDELAFVP